MSGSGRRKGWNVLPTKMSNKLLVLMGFGAVMAFAGNGFILTDALLSHRSIDNPSYIIGAVASVLLIGQVITLAILKMRAPQNAVCPSCDQSLGQGLNGSLPG